ncbi:MAG TPA: RND transporter, partial [Burkholderiaceae bacterium]|nr:RND transporter [Burkholderiaceae bacterium]
MYPHFRPGALRLSALPALVLVLMTACAPVPPQPAAPERLKGETLGLKAGETAGTAQADTAWWRAWGDERLDALMDKALRDAPSLALARARIAKAGAAVDNAAAADKPVIGVGLDIERQRFSEHGMYPP